VTGRRDHVPAGVDNVDLFAVPASGEAGSPRDRHGLAVRRDDRGPIPRIDDESTLGNEREAADGVRRVGPCSDAGNARHELHTEDLEWTERSPAEDDQGQGEASGNSLDHAASLIRPRLGDTCDRREPVSLLGANREDGGMTDGRRRTNLLLACGVAAAPIFVAVFTVDGALRRPAYDPMREPVSALALGERGRVQRANFLVTGGLIGACAAGLRRSMPGATWAPRLVGAAAVGLVTAGVFRTDPPLSASGQSVPPATVEGSLHNVASVVVIGSLAAACGTVARRSASAGDAGWAACSAGSGLGVVAGACVFGPAFAGAKFTSVGGAAERATIALGWGWLSALAWRQLRSPSHQRTGASVVA
jgi:hypothetical protein